MLGARTFFALLPADVKDLVKAYYHHASEAWIYSHREVEIQAREKAESLRTLTLYRYNKGVFESVQKLPRRGGSDYIWIDAEPDGSSPTQIAITPSKITYTKTIGDVFAPRDWKGISQVPWVEQPSEEARAAAHRVWRVAQYDLVAAKLALKAAELEYDYPYLYERVCIWLLGVSTARGHVTFKRCEPVATGTDCT